MTNLNSITLIAQAIFHNQVFTKSYADQFHQENERFRINLGMNFSNESTALLENIPDKTFNDNKLTSLDSVRVSRNHDSDNELANKNYVDDSLVGGKILG